MSPPAASRPARPYLPGRGPHPGPLRRACPPRHTEAWEACFAEAWGLLRDGFAWEAHELWELLWKAEPSGPERELLQGLIQLAASQVKTALGEPDQAQRLRERALRRLELLADEVWSRHHLERRAVEDLSAVQPDRAAQGPGHA